MSTRTRLKVLLVTEACATGVGRHVLDLAEGLIERGDRVDLAYGRGRMSDSFDRRRRSIAFGRQFVIDDGVMGVDDLLTARRLRRLQRRHGYDVVHAHAARAGLMVRAAGLRGPTVAYTPHALITQAAGARPAAELRAYGALERALSRRTDLLVHVSESEAEHGRSQGLAPRRRVVIPNGIDPVDAPHPVDARITLDLPLTGPVVGFVGRLTRQKGVDLLLHAWARVVAAEPDAVLVLVGDGPERETLLTLADRLELGRSVRFVGERSGVAAMPAFDVFCLPSRYEGFPYVLLEAMQLGIPVVTTTGAGAEQLLVRGEGHRHPAERIGGAVVRPASGPLADRLISLCADELGRYRCALDARSAVAPFTIDRMVDDTRLAYLDGAPSTPRRHQEVA